MNLLLVLILNIFVSFSVKNRHFYQARIHNVEHAKKAMHVLYKRIFQLICSYIYLAMSFCQYHYTDVSSGALKIAILSKIHIMIFSDILLT